MAHLIFGDRFLSLRQPAWHRLGTVVQEPMSAYRALQLIGDYNVRTEDIITVSGQQLPEHVAILRDPTVDDTQTRVFGVVGRDYQLITPADLSILWDEHTGMAVETIGCLKKGAVTFISSFLPANPGSLTPEQTLEAAGFGTEVSNKAASSMGSYYVRGDEMKYYLMALNPMDGLGAIELRVTPVRVVCANTVAASATYATQTYKLRHTKNAKEQLGYWMRSIVERAYLSANKLQEAFSAMADRMVSPDEAQQVIETVYAFPSEPAHNAPDAVMEKRQEVWEAQVASLEKQRELVIRLFDGEGTGMDSVAAFGTGWGLLQAVTEAEDYRRARGSSPTMIAESSLVGSRAKRKEKAFDTILELVTA